MPPPVKKTPAKTPSPVKRKPVAKKKAPAGTSWGWKIALVGLLLILLSPFYYGYILRFGSATWRWILDIGQDTKYRTYKSFNVRIPGGYTVHGIDVSSYQGKINWQKVKAMEEDGVQIKFAFIKATEGVLLSDPYFQRNWREAARAGITCGAYHFFLPQKSGLWQARFFLQTVKVEKGDLPMVVDVEKLYRTTPEKMRAQLTLFINQVESKTGVKPIIYTNISFYQDYLQGYFDEYPLWIAHYYQPQLNIGAKTNWQFWQHSDKARINGINQKVDMSIFRGDTVAFEKLLVK
ncbi:glycoside hydrolase family 25 protein [Mucilaginibacter flavus]|uniref:glycoside hydrolase family 25 protein n=1 Tax=Mucilaginibacter flavus TaxID=931504 RepID=UPI0025B3BDA4|nr:glycoside hydrolase family 25 protein [Mucilaginibacter flavus]MDN3584311.1 glycoside hydrolase family 25 protein [Mucilaginibacter flavus]